MYIIYFFDFGPLIFGFLILIMSLVGELMEFLPILEGIFWILFAVLCIAALVMIIMDSYNSIFHRIIFAAVIAGCLLFMGKVSDEFFSSLSPAYGEGGLNGFIELFFTVFAGCIKWCLCFVAATFVGISIPATKDGELTIFRLLLSGIATAGLLWFAF